MVSGNTTSSGRGVGGVLSGRSGPVFGLQKSGALLAGKLFRGSVGFSFVSAQFAVHGVIADSEYVDCMGNNRASTLYGTLADLDHNRWARCTMANSCY